MNELKQILEAIKRLEKGQTQIITRLDNLEEGQKQILKRVENLETDVKSIKTTVERIDNNIDQMANSSIDEEKALKTRVTRIEKYLKLSPIPLL